MSTRERWTVYPLLFLTLGIALTDKITRQVQTDTVVCKKLLVTDRSGKNEQVTLTSNAGGGLVRAQGNNRRLNVLLGQAGQLAGLMFTDPNDKPVGLGTTLHVMAPMKALPQPVPDDENAPSYAPQLQSPPADSQSPAEQPPGEEQP